MVLMHIVRSRVATSAPLLALALLAGGGVSAQEPAPPPQPQAPTGTVVDSVVVLGNRRVTDAEVRAATALRPGDFVRGPQIQSAVRRLMATGNFESVEISSRGTPPAPITLLVEVVERPLLAEVNFRGLESVSASTVRDTVGLKTNVPLDPARVAATEAMIRNLLAHKGRQVISIDTSITPLPRPEGAVRLTFEVREGNRLAIADIDFVGNTAFADGRLQGAMRTKEEGFLWFRGGKFDRETFRTDLRERLPEFYGASGYIDFAVLSDTLVVDPTSGKARLTVEVSEGPQYRLGEFRMEGNSRFPTEELERYFRAERRSVLGLPFGSSGERESGEVFDRAALEAATRQVRDLYSNEGYLYAQVEPVIRRVPAETPGAMPRVNVVWAISERQPFYIRRINVAGNTFTHESVIRERLVVLPGDVYSQERLLASYQSIGALGYFETPMPLPDIDPNPELGVVDITFHVKEKQTGNINFGTSIGGGYAGSGGGLSGFLGYSQPNLFGQGKEASIRAEYGPFRRNFEAAYTDPSLGGGRNSGSVSVFHTGDRFSPIGNVQRIRTGGVLRMGIPVPGLFRTRAFLGYSLARTAYDGSNDDQCTPDSLEIACFPDATGSTLSLSATRDTKSHPLFPVAGTRQTLAIDQTGGPLGGNGNYQKLTGGLEWWVPTGSLGGGAPGARPIRFTLGLHARAGTIFGDVSPFPFEKFYLGGTRFGEPLRGYKEASVTALGINERCGGSGFRIECLGDSFLSVTAAYAARVNDQLSVGVFFDAGNVWRDAGQFLPSRLFRGAGVGGTVVTPFGPIGLDVAYGFDRPVPGWEVHFKFGQGF